jgi:hypothetical protein
MRQRELPHRSVLTEINSVLGYVGLILLVYVLWLGWDQRRFLLSEVQAHKLVPMALVFTAYLLSALVTTGVVAELAAVDLLTGASAASLRVEFVTQPGVLPELAEKELILVASRNGAYYVVEREPSPPSPSGSRRRGCGRSMPATSHGVLPRDETAMAHRVPDFKETDLFRGVVGSVRGLPVEKLPD